jgi:hypothetical protein
MNKIAAFAIFGPLRVGFQHLDRCVSDFNRYALDFNHFALDFNCYALAFNQFALDFVHEALNPLKNIHFLPDSTTKTLVCQYSLRSLRFLLLHHGSDR